jgi:hypothetical protein
MLKKPASGIGKVKAKVEVEMRGLRIFAQP